MTGRIKRLAAGILLSAVGAHANEPLTFRQLAVLEQPVITQAMEKAKTWQEEQHGGNAPPTDWLTGTFYSGVFACYQATGDEDYLNAARDWCEAANWQCGTRLPLNADEICSAQTFLDVYFIDQDPQQIEPIKRLIDQYYFDVETIDKKLIGSATWADPDNTFIGRKLWWWCDALYMAPPVLARLSAATGDPKYTELLHRLYRDTVDYLYDPEEFLFFRDKNAFGARTPSGKKVFWGRGNGWVIGGLVRTIDYLPDSDPEKAKYIALFQAMMRKLASLQGADGLWGSSLNDRAWLPEPESSGSSFFCFGLAAGINRGWLDKRTYLPHAVAAWEGLLSCLRDDGKLEWAQLVDLAPRKVRHEDQKNYAQGAFLLAASEMYKLNQTAASFHEVMGGRRAVTIAEDGAWTWYNDERAVFWGRYLMTGYVKSDGTSAVGAYLLPGVKQGGRNRLKEIPLSTWQQNDDHNNPSLLALDQDRLLAVYAQHNSKPFFNTRVITKHLEANEEKIVTQKDRATYANLFRLSGEDDRIYDFFRCIGFCPTMTWSDDEGETWSESIQVLKLGDNRDRPYVKYASDKAGRVDFFYTDGHPRNVKDNSVYHLYYEGGSFHRSNGETIKSVEELAGGPMLTKDGTLIYDGSGPEGRGCVHDFERGENGELAGVYINSHDGDDGLDLRYRYARFDPAAQSWSEREIAFAGPHLYVPENHYAGGICIDPSDINVVYLSSALDPATGTPNGTGRFQLYRGTTGDGGETWAFEQLTFDLKRDNLRPFVPRERPDDLNEVMLWFRGEYRSYREYQCEIVGFVQ